MKTYADMDIRDAYRALRVQRKLRNIARWSLNAAIGALAVWLLLAVENSW